MPLFSIVDAKKCIVSYYDKLFQIVDVYTEQLLASTSNTNLTQPQYDPWLVGRYKDGIDYDLWEAGYEKNIIIGNNFCFDVLQPTQNFNKENFKWPTTTHTYYNFIRNDMHKKLNECQEHTLTRLAQKIKTKQSTII